MPLSEEKIAHERATQIVARRVREARKSRGWTQAELAERLEEVGYPKTRDTLTKLESGQQRGISVDDVFALAAALGVNPVHLLTPLEDNVPVAITNSVVYPAWVVRRWIGGTFAWLPGLPDTDFAQIPESELAERIVGRLERDMTPLTRGLMHDETRARARRLAKQLRNPNESPEKEEDYG
jgi:transcriptional regulator with XRE-family HTH domain